MKCETCNGTGWKEYLGFTSSEQIPCPDCADPNTAKSGGKFGGILTNKKPVHQNEGKEGIIPLKQDLQYVGTRYNKDSDFYREMCKRVEEQTAKAMCIPAHYLNGDISDFEPGPGKIVPNDDDCPGSETSKLKWRGIWEKDKKYYTYDVVDYDGDIYVCALKSCKGCWPAEGEYYDKMTREELDAWENSFKSCHGFPPSSPVQHGINRKRAKIIRMNQKAFANIITGTYHIELKAREYLSDLWYDYNEKLYMLKVLSKQFEAVEEGCVYPPYGVSIYVNQPD